MCPKDNLGRPVPQTISLYVACIALVGVAGCSTELKVADGDPAYPTLGAVECIARNSCSNGLHENPVELELVASATEAHVGSWIRTSGGRTRVEAAEDPSYPHSLTF